MHVLMYACMYVPVSKCDQLLCERTLGCELRGADRGFIVCYKRAEKKIFDKLLCYQWYINYSSKTRWWYRQNRSSMARY